MADGFDDIVRDHRLLLEMIADYHSRPDDGLAHRICADVAVHARAEETTLYVPLRELGSGESQDEHVVDGVDLLRRSLDEHAVVETHVARVLAAPPPDLQEVMRHIGTGLQAHIRFEESEVLPRLVPLVDAAELHRTFAEAKQDTRTALGTPLF